jgi:enoyl-CoA hydratase/carnithine racemase
MEPAYFTRYDQLKMRRDEAGILEVRLHTRDGPCLFGPRTHEHMVDAFYDISRDADTRVMILTGTGDSWIAAFDESQGTEKDDFTVPKNWDRVYWEGKKVLQNLLDIDVPVIAAVNGPALVHSEYILTCDAVLASDNTVFQDLPHLAFGLVPGDGVHVLWPHVLGPVDPDPSLHAGGDGPAAKGDGGARSRPWPRPAGPQRRRLGQPRAKPKA